MQETPREYYKRIGICPKCKKRKAFGNYVHCAECLEEIRINNLKYDDRRPEYEKRHNENKKIQYRQRKQDGICVMCGKKKANLGVYCSECHCKRLSRRRDREKTGREYGEAFRERMRMGLCMYCEKPQVNGYRFCEEHLKVRRKVSKKMISRNDSFRKENDAFWMRKLKNSGCT